ncbi:lipopolysaccharide biosynthesis protein [Agromyces silvae]|uniref:lipopolysaccharide biosynthesis protein n=1 Tax=Agromyces silvae TaxID=3388266 RepID=UPI00280AC007|nr:lipopolysaccharide biosynthesis protein [Agromyces protaetiae]
MTSTDGLGAAASRGAKYTMLGQIGRILVQLVSVVLLSRLLDPSDFGLFAMVIAVIGVGEVFRDFGLTQAAVQARTLSREQQSNLFWLNTGIGLALSVVAFLASWPIAALYDDPRLILLTQAVSIVFLVNGLGTQYRAQLTRELRFFSLAAIELVAQVIALGAAVIVAIGGGSYWALAVQQVAAALLALVLLLIVTRWLPGRFYRGVGTMAFLRFGGFLAVAQVITYASKNVDSVIIGARLGATDLGLYNRAFQILVLPLNQINAPATRVALPVLARLQDERARFEKYLLTAQSILLQPVAAGFALGAALAEPLIRIVLGEGWSGAVPIFQILAISGIFQAAAYASYWVFLAHGLTKSQLYWALVSRPFIILGVVIGSFWGLEGVAWGYTVSTALVWPAGLLWIRAAAKAPALAMFLNGLRATIAYGAAGGAAAAVYRVLADSELWIQLVVSTTAFAAVVAIAALVWPRFRADLSLVMHLRGARRKF